MFAAASEAAVAQAVTRAASAWDFRID